MTRRSSGPARTALAALVFDYLVMAVLAGARNSPLTVLLPPHVRAPEWAASAARLFGLDRLDRNALTALAWILLAVALAAFVVVVREAWRSRVGLPTAVAASAVSLSISVAAPVFLSHDVMTYAAYGRVAAIHHHNPYVAPLSKFPHDPFVAATPGQWLHTHSPYGPLFSLASSWIVRAGTPATTIFLFKLLAGAAMLACVGCAAFAAARVRPARAPLAAALVGLNPVIVVHTVGGGHIDALVAAPLAAALAIAVTRPPPPSRAALGVTVLLTLACLLKPVVVPALALWVVWLARRRRSSRGRLVAVHGTAVAALAAASLTPFRDGWHTFAPLVTLGGVEAWASPSQFVARAAEGVAGPDARVAVEAVFLFAFVGVVLRLARGVRADAADAAGRIGAALFLLPLSMPFLLPWYAAWFVPFLGVFRDDVLVVAGALATAVLALTLVPADPLRGLTTPAVMDGVHFGAAPVLLVVLFVGVSRVVAVRRRTGLLSAGSTATSV